MRKFLKVFVFSILCIFTILFVSCSQNQSDNIDKNNLRFETEEQQNQDNQKNEQPNQTEEQGHPNIEDEFAPDKVIISINQKYSNHVFTIEDFVGLELEGVKCLTEYGYEMYSDGNYPENFYHMYTLILKEKTKENVLEAIKVLEQYDFVENACPNYIWHLYETVE